MQIKFSSIQQGVVTLALACTLMLAVISGAGAESLAILKPAAGMPENLKIREPGQETEGYVKRVGGVSFCRGSFAAAVKGIRETDGAGSLFSSARPESVLFSDREFHIQVDSQARPKEHILSLNGHLQGSELATFSLTVTPKSYLIKLQNLDTALLYRVVGDTETGEGRVTEIDLREMPPMKHLPPLVPPEQ